jgi:hypothetical protein
MLPLMILLFSLIYEIQIPISNGSTRNIQEWVFPCYAPRSCHEAYRRDAPFECHLDKRQLVGHWIGFVVYWKQLLECTFLRIVFDDENRLTLLQASTACFSQPRACYNNTGSSGCETWEAKCTEIQNAVSWIPELPFSPIEMSHEVW